MPRQDLLSIEAPRLRTFGYVSTPALPFLDRDLSDLLRASRRVNRHYGVTGKLIALEDADGVHRFAQVVEGAAESLAVVVARIRADPRHTNLIVVQDAPTAHRRFVGWEMSFERVAPSRFTRASGALFAGRTA